ncbi:MAG: DUF4373 domain-containing protein [Bacteroides sp.]|nr:DUF4373 domain-containing protein [Bacteroides sp.]MBD5373163.1 DUF4373 domain-containing protein [Bacteroides sp.]
MNSFRHDCNERCKSNVLKLRMKYGAAGYGVYMMLLERLAMEPKLCHDMDYDALAYEFQVSADLIRHVVEDFDLFIIDLDTETFSHEELTAQFATKARRAREEKALDEFIERRLESEQWVNNIATMYKAIPERVKALTQSVFRDRILSTYTFLPSPSALGHILGNLIRETFKPDDE